MATIHVRDVSERTVTTLKVRAAQAGQSLQAYIRQLLESEAAVLTPEEAAERALDLLGRMALTRYSHVPLLTRIWQLRHNVWPYDAAYVALAETLEVDLVTVDGKVEKVPGIRCTVRNLRNS